VSCCLACFQAHAPADVGAGEPGDKTRPSAVGVVNTNLLRSEAAGDDL
jgi:hypothetical protein